MQYTHLPRRNHLSQLYGNQIQENLADQIGSLALQKAEELGLLGDDPEQDLEKGRPAMPLGAKATWGGKVYLKTASGWKPVGKKRGHVKEHHDFIHDNEEKDKDHHTMVMDAGSMNADEWTKKHGTNLHDKYKQVHEYLHKPKKAKEEKPAEAAPKAEESGEHAQTDSFEHNGYTVNRHHASHTQGSYTVHKDGKQIGEGHYDQGVRAMDGSADGRKNQFKKTDAEIKKEVELIAAKHDKKSGEESLAKEVGKAKAKFDFVLKEGRNVAIIQDKNGEYNYAFGNHLAVGDTGHKKDDPSTSFGGGKVVHVIEGKREAVGSMPAPKGMSQHAVDAYNDVANGMSSDDFYKKHKVGDYDSYKDAATKNGGKTFEAPKEDPKPEPAKVDLDDIAKRMADPKTNAAAQEEVFKLPKEQQKEVLNKTKQIYQDQRAERQGLKEKDWQEFMPYSDRRDLPQDLMGKTKEQLQKIAEENEAIKDTYGDFKYSKQAKANAAQKARQARQVIDAMNQAEMHNGEVKENKEAAAKATAKPSHDVYHIKGAGGHTQVEVHHDSKEGHFGVDISAHTASGVQKKERVHIPNHQKEAFLADLQKRGGTKQ